MSSLVAADSTTGGGGSLLIFAIPVLLIGFMFITQRRRAKATAELQSALGVGDEITTTSGLLGTIRALDGAIATLEVSPGVNVRIDRRAIAGPAPATGPTTPPADSDPATGSSETDGPPDPTSLTK